MTELLTASRIYTLLGCSRRHYWRYEVGLRSTSSSDALRFGTAWHTAMEARWKGATIDEAFAKCLEGKTLDELQLATLSAMLGGYYRINQFDPIAKMIPEIEFRYPMAGSRTFDCAGKIDGVTEDGKTLIEHKTAGCDIQPDSDYWNRLRGNVQIMQYVLAARELGHSVDTVIYDVARKPTISPKQINRLDENGCKIVLDRSGIRVMKKDGTPRESADTEKGWAVWSAIETPEQFGDRLAADTVARPDFYFARREVPVLDDDLNEFIVERQVLARQILACRHEGRRAKRPEHGWPRNVCEQTCKYCEFSNFCLQNVAIDINHPPAGFASGEANSELSNETKQGE
jgi:hypothetical protein